MYTKYKIIVRTYPIDKIKCIYVHTREIVDRICVNNNYNNTMYDSSSVCVHRFATSTLVIVLFFLILYFFFFGHRFPRPCRRARVPRTLRIRLRIFSPTSNVRGILWAPRILSRRSNSRPDARSYFV